MKGKLRFTVYDNNVVLWFKILNFKVYKYFIWTETVDMTLHAHYCYEENGKKTNNS